MEDQGKKVLKEDATPPSREQVVAWYEDQIEMSNLRERLARSQRKVVEHEVKRYHALSIMAQMKEGPEENNTKNADPTSEHKATMKKS
jgi:hypothetical protein